jgi:hypothetical protein
MISNTTYTNPTPTRIISLNLCLGILLSLFLGSTITAQDFKADMALVSTQMLNAKKIHILATIKTYNYSSDSAFEVQHAELKLDGSNLYRDFNDIIYIQNSKETVLLQKKYKKMTLSNTTKETTTSVNIGEQSMKILLNQKDSLDRFIAKQLDNIFFVDSVGSIHHYSLVTKDAEVMKTDYFIDVVSKTIKALVFYYNPAKMPSMSKMEMNYRLFDNNAQFTDNDFSKDNYITKINGRWTPSPQYKGYAVSVFK